MTWIIILILLFMILLSYLKKITKDDFDYDKQRYLERYHKEQKK